MGDQPVAARSGAARGLITARGTNLARDLCNAPATHLTATGWAEIAEDIGPPAGSRSRSSTRPRVAEMGLRRPARVSTPAAPRKPGCIKLTYRPDGASSGQLALVGKGIMYDAGGISLKPSDAMHALMKLDMSGAARDLRRDGRPSRDLGCRATVTGYLMCTDNMPSGTATRLGDVLTIRGGKTVEVVNADAEGRLVMADGHRAGGRGRGRRHRHRRHPDRRGHAHVRDGRLHRCWAPTRRWSISWKPLARPSDEPLWELPLVRAYRRQLDSKIADIKNMGGENAGTITAACSSTSSPAASRSATWTSAVR